MARRLLLLVPLALGAAVPAPAQAALDFRPCARDTPVGCATLDVPLDRSGRMPGTVPLHVERLRARGRSTGALVALAGGPGEAAAPLLAEFAIAIEPALRGRDLIAFDQRGTGRSGLLRCPGLERPSLGIPGAEVQVCARTLGPRRAFYTTLDSVEDIEALRRAIEVDRIALYGTSYGTKVALAYAARYPMHVERLLLDSVVPLDGPDPFSLDVLGALSRVLRSLCAQGACRRITQDPVADLSSLVARIGRSPVRGRLIGGDGRARGRRLGRLKLLRILLGGDFDPSLRSELPGAVRAALRGDGAPLLRLSHRTSLLETQVERPQEFSTALYAATLCEDGPLPWQPAAAFSDRWGQAISRAGSLPDRAFYPFDRATARASDTLRLCATWPTAAPQPVLTDRPLPKVPTLLLSGEADLRTPSEGATKVAAQIPGSIHLVLPGTGHAALFNDFSFCASEAVERFFRNQRPLARCPLTGQLLRKALFRILFRVRPLPPASLRDVPAARGVRGRAGRTLRAFELSLADGTFQQAFLLLGLGLEEPDRPLGGLRGGRIRADGKMERYSYVPGVEVTSLASPPRRGRRRGRDPRIQRFRIAGAAASRGVLRVDGRKRRISGRLGGHRIDTNLVEFVETLLGADLPRELEIPLQARRSSARARTRYRCCPLIR